jgi:hypothetical protein
MQVKSPVSPVTIQRSPQVEPSSGKTVGGASTTPLPDAGASTGTPDLAQSWNTDAFEAANGAALKPFESVNGSAVKDWGTQRDEGRDSGGDAGDSGSAGGDHDAPGRGIPGDIRNPIQPLPPYEVPDVIADARDTLLGPGTAGSGPVGTLPGSGSSGPLGGGASL